MPSFPYVIVNAFARSPLGGNPAAVVLLPPGTLTPALRAPAPVIDAPTMAAVGKSFAQPITVFVASPSPETDDDGAFDVRFFVHDCAVPMCGHGTLATTKAIYRGLLQGLGAKRGDAALRFRTDGGLTIRARAVPRPRADLRADDDDELYEIELPTAPVKPLLGKDRDRVHEAVARALRKDAAHLVVHFVARGTGSVEPFLMVVLSASEELDGRDVDINALLDVGPFGLISLSHLTPGKAHAFESRVFAPAMGVSEDQVCGSAHTLMMPYYASLRESRVKPGQQAYVRQVSPRGGDLWVTLEEQREVVVFRGNAKLFAKGELML